ncbi:MAG TPA: glucosamine-6-phosphate deaminase [Pseudogracilibacillus sp.]|nr:glucosamine-6-phosphate deaminase [Pseudogracilibacillus sp.]
MDIIKVKNSDELGIKAAEIVASRLKTIENPNIGLATGTTPEKLYANLVQMCQRGVISFKHTTTFNLDEYVGLAHDDPTSYHYYMEKHLFSGIDINRENAHVLDGEAKDLEQECTTFEKLIEESGKLHMQILGLGLNGHIGFNEPGTPFDSRTHIVELDQVTIEANARFFDSIDDVPTRALTMGIGTIMEAKEILFLVQGEKKADILRKVVYGEVTEEVPASILQRHPNATLLTDIDL